MTDTAPCTKCHTEIPTGADRCRECGHEPGPGILGGIVMWICLSIGSITGTLTLVTTVVVIDSFPVLQALPVIGIAGFLSIFFFGTVYAGYRSGQRGPTDQPGNTPENNELSDASKARLERLVELEDTAEKRGEEIGGSINDLPRAIVIRLPLQLWLSGILLGAVLNLSVWATATSTGSTAMSIGILGGLFTFFPVVSDVYRVNDVYDTRYRWWFWSIASAVPLFGWIFAVGWLWRRRGATSN